MKEPAPTVFISSTVADLRPCRDKAAEAARACGFLAQMSEDWPARDKLPLAECLRLAAAADLVVAIVAHRYGWIPPDQPESGHRSITWLECARAAEGGKEVLAFVLEDDVEWPDELKEEHELVLAHRQRRLTPQLAEEVRIREDGLKDFKKWLNTRAIRQTFRNPEDLRGKISDALRHWRDRTPRFCIVPEHLSNLKSAEPADPARYLEYLREDTGYIEIRGLQAAEGKARRFPIDDLYVTLLDELASTEAGMAREPSSLDRALANPRLVIVGDPGAGKTTFLRRIVHAACLASLSDKTTPAPLLIRVPDLADFIGRHASEPGPRPETKDAPGWAAAYLASQSRDYDWALGEGYFRALTGAGCLVAFDGLDEAPGQDAREAVSRLIERAAKAWPKCRIVVTTRPQAYEGDVVLGGFHHARIAPLREDAVRVFLDRWAHGLFPESEASARRHAAGLIAAVESRAEIRRIAASPVMLTALAVLHWHEKRLPEQRAELYESILKWLSRSRRQRPGRANPEKCLGLLTDLAWAMQSGGGERLVQVPREWAAEALAPRFREAPETERLGRARQFLEEEELDSGIVVRRGSDIRFWHLTFQEYLTACALAELPEAAAVLFGERKAYRADWREAVLLLGGVLFPRRVQRLDGLISAAIDGMYGGGKRLLRWFGVEPGLAEKARCAALLGAMMRDLQPLGYVPADARYPGLMQSVLGIFELGAAERLPLRVRIEAAEALGRAGDPRLLQEHWIEIPACSFMMGEGDDAHKVELSAYRIGRYPVTVQEYAKFMEAGGYEDERWWAAGKSGAEKAPRGWHEQRTHPNRPVVGVNWYEAAAYCAWRGRHLPTEAQWERAAGGTEGRIYPWGDEGPDVTRANYDKTGLNAPTPVGLFPRGRTPEGIDDLAGNVWEWMLEDYDGAKALRGGSWDGSARVVGVSCRNWVLPDSRDNDIGFRCVGE